MSADNQQGSLTMTPQRLHAEPLQWDIYRAYLLGAVHDGTYNKLHNSFRFSQNNYLWLKRVKSILKKMGYKSWIYKEGKNRNVYALETTASCLEMNFDPFLFETHVERTAYVRGYFDAEGGTPQSLKASFYIQICQKNRTEIEKIKLILKELNISSGKIHNPSKAVDPNYWRFYISAKSHRDFVTLISSWHPRKYQIFQSRVMI